MGVPVPVAAGTAFCGAGRPPSGSDADELVPALVLVPAEVLDPPELLVAAAELELDLLDEPQPAATSATTATRTVSHHGLLLIALPFNMLPSLLVLARRAGSPLG
jgi:hypothetical protein